MARGSEIIVSANPQGKFDEGYIASGQTPKPGTIMQIDPTVALKGGRHTWKIYDRAASGDRPAGPLIILLNDTLRGQLPTTAYAAGDHCFGYVPQQGEEFNLLLEDIAGTADDHPLGEILMVKDATGKLIVTTGTPQQTPFVLLEAVTDPVADTLAWVRYGL